MTMRSNSFALLHICIISILVNCSTCAERMAFSQVNIFNDSLLGNNRQSANVRSNNSTSRLREVTFDYAKPNETSHLIGDDSVSLPIPAYYVGAENSNNLSIGETARHERAADPQDICDTSECKCKQESNFLTVDCYFQQRYRFTTNNFVRPSAETLLITLSHDAEFRLDGNVFANNRLNRIMIQGSGSDFGQEHVEISSNAFDGNAGPFPEIEIVNVHTVIIASNAFFFEFKLNITNCAKVQIFAKAFANTTFHGHFDNIRDFQLRERAFSKSNARITIHNSHLDELKRLTDATLKEIKFSNTHIATIQTNAFDVISIDSISFENCHIGNIQANAFTEKLYSKQLSLIGCNIDTIEAYAISGCGITDVMIQNNSISNIKGKAITLTSITTLIQGNNISFTDKFWYRVEKWSNVLIEKNHFGVYQIMAVENTPNPTKCLFEDNYITKTVAESLSFKSPNCRVKQVSFDRVCTCNSTYFRQLSYIDLSPESYCKVDIALTHCFNATLYNVKSYKDDICGSSSNIDCTRDGLNAKLNGYFISLDRFFNRTDKLVYVYLGLAILLIVCIIFLLCLIARRCFKSKKDLDDGPTRDIMLMESLHPMTIDRTTTLTTQIYREPFIDSDLIIINQTLKEMKQKYPPEIYDQIDNNTRKLIGGNLTETDKVKTIGEIVQCLNDFENTDIDFIAFTDILYNHLGVGSETTHTHHVTGPIYAEPGLVHLDIVNSTNKGKHNMNFIGEGAEGEHIYAEPVNLQQPLLRSEYNVPIDHSDNNSHLYTEPVTGAIDYISSPRPNIPINKNFDPSHLYAQPSKAARPNPVKASTSSAFASVNRLPKISALGEKFKNSAHSSSQESTNSNSSHSGASGATLPLDEPIEYADA